MTLQQLQTMLVMQDKMNSVINPKWKTQGWDFSAAILVEAGELIKHIGWKWWKKQDANIEQAKIELVDIWHFGMSHMISTETLIDAEYITRQLNREEFIVSTDFNQAIVLAKLLVSKLETEGEFCMYAFRQIMYKLDMSTDELYQLYVAKNALNHFRQANGYKTGDYYKIWNGEEDNVVMMAELKELDACSPDLYDDLQARLQHVYKDLAENNLLSN